MDTVSRRDLAVEESPHLMDATKLGVLAGSIVSALLGALVLRLTLRRPLRG